MSKREVIKLGIDICSALELCSNRGIIHRDIKDDNIFVNQDGVFKLGDFGISKELSKSGRAASMRGTPLYMAPEVYRGDKYDAAVDIYSLGIVMYKLLNHGRMPFMPPYPDTIRFKDSEAALEKRMSGQLLPQPDQAGEVLGNVILKACAYQTGDRYATPTEMKRGLERVLSSLSDASKAELVTMLNNKSQESSPTNQSALTCQPEPREKTVSIFGAGLTEATSEPSDKPESKPENLSIESVQASTQLPQRDLNKTESIFASSPKPATPVDEIPSATAQLPNIAAGPKKTKKPSREVIARIIVVVIVLILAVAIKLNSQSAQTSTNTISATSEDAEVIYNYGNSTGNIVNTGIAAQKGDWVYYQNGSDNYTLYKIRTDCTNKTRLNSDYSFNINIVDDCVYYGNGSDNNTLYKIRTDGTGRTKLNSDESIWINVVGDWIYYSNMSDAGCLYKIRTDGTGKTKLNSDKSAWINAVGNWVYYVNGSDNSTLYKIRTDGTEKTKLNSDGAGWINVVANWVYYGNGSDNSTLYKNRTDSTGKTKLNNDKSYCINVVGDWIYYSNMSNAGCLYKIRTDGTGNTLLNSYQSLCINVVGDWVYYVNESDNHTLYKIRTDGTERQKVE